MLPVSDRETHGLMSTLISSHYTNRENKLWDTFNQTNKPLSYNVDTNFYHRKQETFEMFLHTILLYL